MNLDQVLNSKQFFRFTGPPEHWLTAVKFMTWGLEEKYKEQWARISSGDVFFIHSTQNSFFKNAKSGIIGLGVVGTDFSIKKNNLWLFETENDVNRWPLLVPISELYLFSPLPSLDSWENPSKENPDNTKVLIGELLKNLIPLEEVPRFPRMGSFSSVSPEVAKQILQDKRFLYQFIGTEGLKELVIGNNSIDVNRKFKEVKTAAEALRYADTLKIFDMVKRKIIKEPTSQYTRDNDLLELANETHQTILEQLVELFKKHDYTTRYSPTVDLFAHKEDKAFLFEVKSTENRNFRSQARKGIAQLLEYEYFDVQKFSEENSLVFNDKHKLLIPSQIPSDPNYVQFINSLEIGVAMVGKDNLKPIGEDLGFSTL